MKPPPPPPVYVPIPPPQGPTGPTDELSDCCQATATALTSLANSVAQLVPTDPTCCVDIQTQINACATQLQEIAAILSNPPAAPAPAPIDFSAIVSALAEISTTLQSFPPNADANTTTLATQLSGIATAIGNLTPADLQKVVDAINSLFNTLDVPQVVYQQLATDGWLSSTYAQLSEPGALGSGLVSTIATWAHQFWRWLVLSAIGVDVDAPPSSVPIGSTTQLILESTLNAFLKTGDSVLTPTVSGLIDQIAALLKPAGGVSPGNINVNPTSAVTSVLGFTISAAIAGHVASFLGWHDSEALAKFVERIGTVIGFEELREVNLGPLIRFGIARIAEQQARQLFRQELPNNGVLAGWLGRGLITQQAAETVFGLNGLDNSYFSILEAAAQQGINPRQLVRLMNTGLFSSADLTDELTFAGVRPASQSRYQLAAPFLATSTERSKLVAALESAYAGGLYSDTDLTSLVDSAYSNTDRDSLLLKAAQVKALERDTKDLEASYGELYLAGLIDQPTLQSNLQGIGLQDHFITSRMAVLEAKASARLQRQMQAQEQRLATQTTNIERRTALQNFMSGSIDIVAYTAALVATGMTAVQAAAWADLAVLKQQGNLRWVYGMVKTPQEAEILKNQVTAILDQRKTLLISDATAASQLSGLGLAPTYVNALIAAADASAVVKTAASLYPVTPS